MYRVQCPSCRLRIKVNDKLFGRKVSCKCGHVLRMPAAPGSAGASEAADELFYSCTGCGKKLKVPNASAGKMATCPCGTTCQIPTPVKLQIKNKDYPPVRQREATPGDPLLDPLAGEFAEPFNDPMNDPLGAVLEPASDPFAGQTFEHSTAATFSGSSYQSTKNKSRTRSRRAKGNGNTMGLIGFIVSLVSAIFLCGFLSPISLILSLLGLKREPKGFAIAGLVISVLGCFYSLAAGLIIVASFSEMKASVEIAMAKAHVHNACVANDGVLPNQLEFEQEAGSLADSIAYEAYGNDRFLLTHRGPDGIQGTRDDVSREFVFDSTSRDFVESQFR